MIEAKLFIDISNKKCINKLVVMIFTEYVLDSGAVPDASTIDTRAATGFDGLL